MSNYISKSQISSFMKLSDEEKLEVATGFIEFVRAFQTSEDHDAYLSLKRA